MAGRGAPADQDQGVVAEAVADETSWLLTAAGGGERHFGTVQADAEAAADSCIIAKGSAAAAEADKAAYVIPTYISKKIKALQFFGTLCVMYIHAYTGRRAEYKISMNPVPRNLVHSIEAFASGGLLRFAVPMFFTISGVLFFARKRDDFPHFMIARRIQARLWSLIVPFILWNLVAIGISGHFSIDVGMVPVSSFQRSLLEMWIQPVMPQLWYLRDLMLLALLSPWILAAARIHCLVLLIFAELAAWPWVLSRQPREFIGVQILDFDGLVFFSFGAYLALRRVNLEYRLSSSHTLSLLFAWISLYSLKAVVCFVKLDKTPGEESELKILHKLGIPLGVATVWFGYDHLEPWICSKRIWPWLSWLSGYTMWIFCAHMPLLCLITRIGMDVINTRHLNQSMVMMLYVLSPLVSVLLLLAVGVPLSMYCGGTFALLTGGRGGA